MNRAESPRQREPREGREEDRDGILGHFSCRANLEIVVLSAVHVRSGNSVPVVDDDGDDDGDDDSRRHDSNNGDSTIHHTCLPHTSC